MQIVGLIATTWLIMADRTPDFVNDSECLYLAALHSAAVDYPKSGIPVHHTDVPKLQGKKPDWSAPETMTGSSENYYPSKRAVGLLF